MKVLIIGRGGREHAITWKIAQSSQVSEIFVAPGNAGTNLENKTTNINIKSNNITELLNFAKNNNIDLTIVGPETPLVAGIVDVFRANNLNILGPNKDAAQIEGSKTFCKKILKQAGVPTANYQEFTNKDDAYNYIKNKAAPYVIKADGLANGKGVCIAKTLYEAETIIADLLSGKTFGDSGKKIIIEDFLLGQEASFIALISNNIIIPLVSSQDHKARDNQDQGPNTGGMGAYSPAPIITSDLNNKIIKQIIQPTINCLTNNGISYSGFLYAGLMIDDNNNINVLEYNCRLGDPEAQVILPRLKTDFFDLCYKAATNKLDNNYKLQWTDQAAITVVLASRDYPDTPIIDEVIIGLENIDNKYNYLLSHDDSPCVDKIIPAIANTPYSAQDFCKVFHAATTYDAQHNIKTNGGRVLAVTALASDLEQAHYLAYGNIKNIFWPSIFYRTDIGAKALS